MYYEKASRMPGNTGEELLTLIERRLDNVVYRLGFAATRREARQLVSHGHFSVNGKRVDVPSYLVKPGDVVAVTERSASTTRFKKMKEEDAFRSGAQVARQGQRQPAGTVVTCPSARTSTSTSQST